MAKTANQWYVSGGGIARSGPHPTEKAAWNSMRLTTAARYAQRITYGTDSPYPMGTQVWQETPAEVREWELQAAQEEKRQKHHDVFGPLYASTLVRTSM